MGQDGVSVFASEADVRGERPARLRKSREETNKLPTCFFYSEAVDQVLSPGFHAFYSLKPSRCQCADNGNGRRGTGTGTQANRLAFSTSLLSPLFARLSSLRHHCAINAVSRQSPAPPTIRPPAYFLSSSTTHKLLRPLAIPCLTRVYLAPLIALLLLYCQS